MERELLLSTVHAAGRDKKVTERDYVGKKRIVCERGQTGRERETSYQMLIV